MPEAIIWGILFIILTIIEAQTFQFVSIWFAISALVTLFFTFTNVSLLGQAVIFVVLSALLLVATRPIVKKKLIPKFTPTNADLDVGKTAIVIESIDNDRKLGRVKLDGVDWMARSSDGSLIPKEQSVIVQKVDGAKLFVRVK